MKTQRIGGFEIRKVVEIDAVRVDPRQFFTNITPEVIARHRDALGPSLMTPDTGDLLLSHHSFVIRTRGRTILVDTCNGNHKERPGKPEWHRLSTRYLENLEAAGTRPEDVDVVLCTHLHADHVGWNTRLRDGQWVPTFPAARYLIARAEFAHYSALHEASPEVSVNRGSFADSVLPVFDHDQADLVDGAHRVEISEEGGVWLEPAPGHTPGNVNVVVRDGSHEALLCGDVIHHPIQVAEPWLQLPADFDCALAQKTRRAVLDRCADTDTVLLTGHFPDPTAGVVRRAGAAYAFAFES